MEIEPYAPDLTDPFHNEDPDTLNATRVQWQCLRCGLESGWADNRNGGALASNTWRSMHKSATGHRRFYLFTLDRQIVE